MSAEEEIRPPAVAPGLTVREATPDDNDALITVELQCPLLVGDIEETYDRSPDSFAFHRVQPDPRVVLAELDGRVIGVMAGVVHTPVIQGEPHRLVYIHQARVHPDFHHKGAAWAMASDLFAWSRERGAEGPYYLIAPGNEQSIAFGGRAGRRWPVDLTLLEFDVTDAGGDRAQGVPEERLAEAADLVNRTHSAVEFFEPLTPDSLAARLRARLYGVSSLRGLYEGGKFVAVAGLWDRGATTERIHFDSTTGTTSRSRGAAVPDWGWAVGWRKAFPELLRALAAEARALGRSGLTICEPLRGAVPDIGLARRRSTAAVYTPTLLPPPRDLISGLWVDLLHV